jgi:hypothetical protein
MTTIEEIRTALQAAMGDDPSTIVPCVRSGVLDLRDQLTEDMSDARMVTAIHNLGILADDAGEYGRPDLADSLDAVQEALRARRSDPC